MPACPTLLFTAILPPVTHSLLLPLSPLPMYHNYTKGQRRGESTLITPPSTHCSLVTWPQQQACRLSALYQQTTTLLYFLAYPFLKRRKKKKHVVVKWVCPEYYEPNILKDFLTDSSLTIGSHEHSWVHSWPMTPGLNPPLVSIMNLCLWISHVHTIGKRIICDG